LFLTERLERSAKISRLLKYESIYNFIWITDKEKMFCFGLGAPIWSIGGETTKKPKSILGPTLACKTPLPQIK